MISAIDIALWDIRGKVLGLPISELFGGPVRDGIPIYCHPQNGSSPEDTAQHAKAIVETGQKAMKLDPFVPKHEEDTNGYLVQLKELKVVVVKHLQLKNKKAVVLEKHVYLKLK